MEERMLPSGLYNDHKALEITVNGYTFEDKQMPVTHPLVAQAITWQWEQYCFNVLNVDPNYPPDHPGFVASAVLDEITDWGILTAYQYPPTLAQRTFINDIKVIPFDVKKLEEKGKSRSLNYFKSEAKALKKYHSGKELEALLQTTLIEAKNLGFTEAEILQC